MRAAFFAQSGLSKEQKKTQLQDIQNAHETDMKAVLNADQYAQFSDAKAKRKAEMVGKHKARKANKQ